MAAGSHASQDQWTVVSSRKSRKQNSTPPVPTHQKKNHEVKEVSYSESQVIEVQILNHADETVTEINSATSKLFEHKSEVSGSETATRVQGWGYFDNEGMGGKLGRNDRMRKGGKNKSKGGKGGEEKDEVVRLVAKLKKSLEEVASSPFYQNFIEQIHFLQIAKKITSSEIIAEKNLSFSSHQDKSGQDFSSSKKIEALSKNFENKKSDPFFSERDTEEIQGEGREGAGREGVKREGVKREGVKREGAETQGEGGEAVQREEREAKAAREGREAEELGRVVQREESGREEIEGEVEDLEVERENIRIETRPSCSGESKNKTEIVSNGYRNGFKEKESPSKVLLNGLIENLNGYEKERLDLSDSSFQFREEEGEECDPECTNGSKGENFCCEFNNVSGNNSIDSEEGRKQKEARNCSMEKTKSNTEKTKSNMEKTQSNIEKTKTNVEKKKRNIEIVVYGVGSLMDSAVARCQLALSRLLANEIQVEFAPVLVFDPVLTAGEKEAMEEIGCTPIQENEEGRRVAVGPTLFYMPHCEAHLYDNVLKANRSSPGSLKKIAILGNSFRSYQERWALSPHPKSTRPIHLLEIEKTSEEVLVDPFDFSLPSAFNDMSWHFFPIME